nr:aldehyde dehydrogenase iron-sulfur subunit PaoA [Rhodoferax koreense]
MHPEENHHDARHPARFPLAEDAPGANADNRSDLSTRLAKVWPVSRRGMVQASAAMATVHLAGCASSAATTSAPAQTAVAATVEQPPSLQPVTLHVNGKRHRIEVDTRTTVLDALRENLGLKGSKKGCDHGQCGACTVLIEGRRTNACLSLAVMHDGDEITTIEGLGTPDKLHAMQASFLKHDGFQCGYCTSGQICSSVGMLAEVKMGMPSHVTPDLNAPGPLTDEEIRERMSGNLCRCSAYPNIVASIRQVATGQGGQA